jgi:hypothetical protein
MKGFTQRTLRFRKERKERNRKDILYAFFAPPLRSLRVKNIAGRTCVHLSLLFTFAFLLNLSANAQISPGELSKYHSQLEGMTNCTKCHILGEKVANSKCLACHTELKSRIDLQKGYHSSAEIKGKECVSCHNDHHGKDFQIIRFDKTKFNHTLSGFTLSGKHSQKQCADCHKKDFIKDPKISKKSFTYLGLNTECLTCHKDYHQQTLATGCGDCHDFNAFKPANKFDHTRAVFQLAGKHQEVPCLSCHKITTLNGQKFQEFKGVKYAGCINCHQDPHANKFGQNCAQCHTEMGFSSIKPVNDFNHDRTDFRLEGKHQAVDCRKCHKARFTDELKFARCSDCHTDYHTGQFARNGLTPDCAECHTVNGFAGSSYTIERHNQTQFKLAGGHLATPCIACHKKGDKWSFTNIGTHCSDCHQDIHKGIISEKYYPGADCEKCHQVSRWSAVSFDHNATAFPLSGAHDKKSCRSCHFRKSPEGVAVQQFSGMSVQCSNCHNDIHEGQFAVNGTTDCSRCHETLTFKPASKFDHGKTRFPLDGKHANVPCEKCHQVKNEKGHAFISYKIKSFKCEDCHR